MHCYDKNIRNRLLSIQGHINGVVKMADENESCEKVLLQLSAIEGAIIKLSKHILKDHLNNCVKESILRGEENVLEEFNTVLDKFI